MCEKLNKSIFTIVVICFVFFMLMFIGCDTNKTGSEVVITNVETVEVTKDFDFAYPRFSPNEHKVWYNTETQRIRFYSGQRMYDIPYSKCVLIYLQQ